MPKERGILHINTLEAVARLIQGRLLSSHNITDLQKQDQKKKKNRSVPSGVKFHALSARSVILNPLMIAPHIKSLGGQARNVSYFASLLCQHCQKTIPLLQSSLVNASGFPEELPTTGPSFGVNSLPKCRRFGTQTIRHVSKQEDPDRNGSEEGKKAPSDESESSFYEKKRDEDGIKGKRREKMEEELLLETLTENQETVKCVPIVPGKGPPPDPPLDCCMSGCANCVWIKYAEEMRDYYCADGIEKALKDIEKIEDANLKAYLKLELSFINK